MIGLVSILAVVAVAALVTIVRLERDHHKTDRRNDQADHAKCIAHIASVTSNRVVGQAVHNLAEKWDSIENQADLNRLARERYTPGGPSMPVIWLHEQARLIEEDQ